MKLTNAQRKVIDARFPGTRPIHYLLREALTLLVEAGGKMPAKLLANRLDITEIAMSAIAQRWNDLLGGFDGIRLSAGLAAQLGITYGEPDRFARVRGLVAEHVEAVQARR